MSGRCDAFRALAPDLALGVASGDERADALEHAAGCTTCRNDLAELTAAVDALVQAAPIARAPEGLEQRALAEFPSGGPALATEDLGADHRSAAPSNEVRSGGSSWLHAAAIVLAVLIVAAGGIRWAVSQDDPQATASQHGVLRASAGQAVGGVHVDHATNPGDGDDRDSNGEDDRLVISVDAGAPTGTYLVRCDYEEGAPYAAGRIEVGPAGVARWSAEVDVPTYDLHRVRLVSTTGGENLEAEIGS